MELSYVRKKDFQISFDLGLDDPKIGEELADAVRVVKTSRLNNILLLEICHPVDSMVHQTLEYVCYNGLLGVMVDALHPTKISGDPSRAGYVSYKYEVGRVIDQWTIMSRDELDADDPMLDMLQVQFTRKHLYNRKWVEQTAQPKLVLVEPPAIIVPNRQSGG